MSGEIKEKSYETEEKPQVRAFKHQFPYELEEPTEGEVMDLNERYSGYLSGALKVPPSGYFFQGIYKNYAQDLYDFDFKPSDVIVASYPKCGTTWTQELVWLLANKLDYNKAKAGLDERFPFIEADWVIDKDVYLQPELRDKVEVLPGPYDRLKAVMGLSHPRTIKTHMPFSLLPPDLLDTCKVIYVTRDPRDVVVSFYHHHKLIVSHGFKGDISEFVEDFVNERVMYSPFYSHVKEAHDRLKHSNLLLITYEDMKKDLSKVITDVAEFLGVPITPEQKEKLCQHLHISNMKTNTAVNGSDDPLMREDSFIRTGVSGGWRSLNEQDQAKLNLWFKTKSNGLNEVFQWKE